MQAGKLWNQVLDDFLVEAGLIRSRSLFVYEERSHHCCIMLVWVDDLIIIATNCIDDLNVTQERLYLQKLVCEFDKSFTKQAIIYEDNQGAIA